MELHGIPLWQRKKLLGVRCREWLLLLALNVTIVVVCVAAFIIVIGGRRQVNLAYEKLDTNGAVLTGHKQIDLVTWYLPDMVCLTLALLTLLTLVWVIIQVLHKPYAIRRK